MQFLNAVFGGAGSSMVNGALALGIVLVLIVFGVWLLKLGFKASSNLGRGRNRRLSVVDTLMLDPRRQLVIVRRDNVEHLILTGGPHDLVVETGIAVDRASLRHTLPQQVDEPIVELRDSSTEVPDDGLRHSAQVLGRRAGHPADLHRTKSLRHTGLMRPGAPPDPSLIPMSREAWVDNSDRALPDSAKIAPALETGQAKLAGRKRRLFRGNFGADPS